MLQEIEFISFKEILKSRKMEIGKKTMNCLDFLKMSYKSKKMTLYKLFTFLPNKFEYKRFGEESLLYMPMLVNNKKCISIGNHVLFRERLRLDAIKQVNGIIYSPQIIIEDYVHAEQDCQIFATTKVHIKKNVTLSSNVFITDCEHEYTNIKEGSILSQGLRCGETVIDEEAFLGIGVRIIKAVHIGKHAIIGANAVVDKDIPPYSVAVGIPAKVIKKYNFATNKWEKVTEGSKK